MPRTPQQNQRIKDERRRQIMDAALKVFAEKGLAATMMSDIAAAADLSYGLVYHYFHDKEELFITLVERALQGALRLTEQVRALPGTPWERLRILCGEMVEGARATPEYFRLIVRAQLGESPSSAVHTLVNRYGEGIQGNIAALIHEGQKAGEVAPGDPNELAYLLNAIVQGLTLSLTTYPDVTEEFPSVEVVMRFLEPNHPTQAQEEPHAN